MILIVPTILLHSNSRHTSRTTKHSITRYKTSIHACTNGYTKSYLYRHARTINRDSQLYIKGASHKTQLIYHARVQSMTQLSIIYHSTMVLS